MSEDNADDRELLILSIYNKLNHASVAINSGDYGAEELLRIATRAVEDALFLAAQVVR